MKMRIGELAKMAGCQPVTIRFYEKEGVLAQTERAGNNYRLYDENDLQRLRFILHCRKHGMKLAEIRKLLVLRDDPGRDCAYAHELVKKHLVEVDAQLESLKELRKELEKLLYENSCGNQGHCAIIQKLDASDGCAFCQEIESR